jgi:hypothetical protein
LLGIEMNGYPTRPVGSWRLVVARVLLGFVAALRAVLIPGQAELLMSRPLRWPRRAVPPALANGRGDRRREAAGDVRSPSPSVG